MSGPIDPNVECPELIADLRHLFGGQKCAQEDERELRCVEVQLGLIERDEFGAIAELIEKANAASLQRQWKQTEADATVADEEDAAAEEDAGVDMRTRVLQSTNQHRQTRSLVQRSRVEREHRERWHDRRGRLQSRKHRGGLLPKAARHDQGGQRAELRQMRELEIGQKQLWVVTALH